MDCNPCQPCPPAPPPVCPQVCPPSPPPPPCRHKPIMRGLHAAQTKRNIMTAIALCTVAGSMVYVMGQNRRRAYKEFYAKAELEDWADEMARKGLFQAVPRESFAKK